MKDILEKKVFPKITKCARYLGNELHSVHKDLSKVDLKMALAFPDLYEIGMSNLGLQILYSVLNGRKDLSAERVYAPWLDMEEKLRELKLPLFTLESKTPLSELDMIGFSLQHELTYTNVLNMIDMAGIPVRKADRSGKHPLIFAGGPCTFNPAPLSDFIDFFVIGEAEESVLEVADVVIKNKNADRAGMLKKLSAVEGVYVPGISGNVKKRIIKDLDRSYYPTAPIVPFMEIVHNRAMLEIMRGCPRGCRFCQARSTTYPLRQKSKDVLLKYADELIKNTGFEELSLISLSSSDHKDIEPLILELTKRFKDKKVSISMPSLRLDTFSDEIAKAIREIRQTSITVAPEAGTQRLRDIINKKLSEEEILNGVKRAFDIGIQNIKLYFMIGLPGETEDDLKGIIELSKKILDLGKSMLRKRVAVTVNVSTFIPKPHTPFQWERQISIEETKEKQKYLKENSRIKGMELKWHDAESSWLEGIFSRGDERLGSVVEAAWKSGAKFDAWSEQFKPAVWQEAFKSANIDTNEYLGERKAASPLPWDIIDCGISKGTLTKEREKAYDIINSKS